MIVVDATTWVDYLIGGLSDQHRETVLSGGAISPPHVDFEVGSALARRERRAELDPGAARALATGFARLPFERVRDPVDQVRAFELLSNATYADAIYVAMAKRLVCPVMTSDSGMQECARIADVDAVDTNREPAA